MERYNRLYKIEENLYQVGSPVIILAGALLLDTKTNGTIAQLKFMNLDCRQIKALQISLLNYDIGGLELTKIENFQYLDLGVKQGEEFGSKVPIHLPESNTRSFAVEKCKVFFTDGTVWETASGWSPLPEPSIKEGENEFLKQYRIELGLKAFYQYENVKDLWYCPCGTLNKETESKCINCGLKKEHIKEATDEIVSEKMRLRLQREAQEAEKKKIREVEKKIAYEAEKQKSIELQKAKKAKQKKIIKICCMCVSAIVLAAICLYIGIGKIYPYVLYNSAVSMEAEGNYEGAIKKFEKLGEYKDSKKKFIECSYKEAMDLYEQKNYNAAKYLFEETKDLYDDAESYIENCNLYIALQFWNNGDYDKAKKQLNEIDFSLIHIDGDIINEYKDLFLEYIADSIITGDTDGTDELLSKNFSGSDFYSEMQNKLGNIAIDYINNNDFESSKKVYSKIEDGNVKAQVMEAWYNHSLILFESGDYSGARHIFNRLIGYDVLEYENVINLKENLDAGTISFVNLKLYVEGDISDEYLTDIEKIKLDAAEESYNSLKGAWRGGSRPYYAYIEDYQACWGDETGALNISLKYNCSTGDWDGDSLFSISEFDGETFENRGTYSRVSASELPETFSIFM